MTAAPIAAAIALAKIGLAGARRAPKDHAPRQQFLEPGNVVGVGRLVLELQHVEDFVAQPLLDLGVAADVAVEIDLRHFELADQRRLPQLPIGPLGIGGIILAFERAQQPSQPDRVDAGDVLVQRPRVELPAELAGFPLRDEIPQPWPGDAEQAGPMREQVLDHPRQRERRVLEPEPD